MELILVGAAEPSLDSSSYFFERGEGPEIAGGHSAAMDNERDILAGVIRSGNGWITAMIACNDEEIVRTQGGEEIREIGIDFL